MPKRIASDRNLCREMCRLCPWRESPIRVVRGAGTAIAHTSTSIPVCAHLFGESWQSSHHHAPVFFLLLTGERKKIARKIRCHGPLGRRRYIRGTPYARERWPI